MTLNRGESWLSRIAHEWSDAVHGMPARNARIVRTIDSPGSRGIADRELEEAVRRLGRQGRPRAATPTPGA